MYPLIPEELKDLIGRGEGLTVEFKNPGGEMPGDVYETVCSFSNREGGHIFLGVDDDGTIVGVDEDRAGKMTADFRTAAADGDRFDPPLRLNPCAYSVDGRTVVHIRIPYCEEVCYDSGRVYDRDGDSDIDITRNKYAMRRLIMVKGNICPADRVTKFGMDSLRHDLIERARNAAGARNDGHPWPHMTDEQLLRSSGLILTDEETDREGITVAAILLFGKDTTIMSVLPQHKTDALFRVHDTESYDDRDVIETNLLDSYDRLMAFGAKHLNDTFQMDGIRSVSARDHILREIIANLLSHRDYSSDYRSRMVIEKDRIYTENPSLSRRSGELSPATCEPVSKNPSIEKVFREIGLADDLGSGMRKTYKYTRMYSGCEPVFIEGDMFKTIIPLSDTATATVGPHGYSEQVSEQVSEQAGGQVSEQAGEQVSEQVSEQAVRIARLLRYCEKPRTEAEIQKYSGISSRRYFVMKILRPLIADGSLKMTDPDNPHSPKQRYVRT